MIKSIFLPKLRIGVLMGGKSMEKEVSFNSGRTVCDHLDMHKYEITPLFQTATGDLYLLPWHFLHRGKISDFYTRLDTEAKKIKWDELKEHIDFVYIALHGRFGEDGTIQGLLEILNIPYLGAKVLGSALGMNKKNQKKILKLNGVDVAKDITLSPFQINKISLEQIIKMLDNKQIKLPCIIKPNHEGSSLGITVAHTSDQLLPAIKKAAKCDPKKEQDVLIEERLQGMEFVCVCLKKGGANINNPEDWFALSVTEVIKENGTDLFDYVQKYMPGRATKITPARCSKQNFEKIIKTCIKVTKLLNLSTISRIDGFLTKNGKVIIIDPNSLTGMGPATFLFNQAAEVGMSHTHLINYLVETELQQYGLSKTTFKKNEKIEMQNKNDPKIKIAVLLGGNTNEREISLESGRNICYKLSPQKYEVIPIFINNNLELFRLNQKLLVQNSTQEISDMVTKDLQVKWSDLPKICDFVFIGLHGGIGENGSVQGALEMLDLPYNGSGVLASALCMDKFKTCEFLRNEGFDVPSSKLLNKTNYKQEIKKQKLTFPLILKPHDDGCSMFVKKIKNQEELSRELDLYFKESQKNQVMLEEFIEATELTCGVIGNNQITVLPPSKVLANKEILSLEEKFLPGAGENLTPAPLPQKALALIKQTLQEAYKVLECKGYVRIDFFYQEAKFSPTKKDRVIILEINSLPGMTPATCIFHQAAEIGLRPMEFIDKIIELGMQNHKKIDTSKKVSKHSQTKIQAQI